MIIETEPILTPEEARIFSGLSPQNQAVVLDKIEQGRRLAEILKPFSDEQRNIPIAITQAVQQGPVQTALETKKFPLYGLRRVAAGMYSTLRSYGLEHAARTIFQAPSQTNNAT